MSIAEVLNSNKTKVELAFEKYAKLQAEVKVYENKVKELKAKKEYKDAKAEIVACCKCNEGKLSHMGLTATLVNKKEYTVRAQEYVMITGMPMVESPEMDKVTQLAMALLQEILGLKDEEVECIA